LTTQNRSTLVSHRPSLARHGYDDVQQRNVTVDEKKYLTDRFEADRPRLRAVAHRILGSSAEADDAVQEAWLRLNRTGGEDVNNLPGWLTTVVARVCLDMLRARKSRREEPIGPHVPEPVTGSAEDDSMMADSIGVALLVVLNKLSPAERVAFVLHDMFDLPFDSIAPIINRSTDATRQLASRARRRVQGASYAPPADRERQNAIIGAFLAAAREGNFEALLTVLDPDVVFRPDAAAAAMGGVGEVRGAAAVANLFKGRAQAARPALADGAPGVAVIFDGQVRIVLALTFTDGRIADIEAIADNTRLSRLAVTLLDG
jgi:RNA polymerase sigma-70 factor (ECF subfamily)